MALVAQNLSFTYSESRKPINFSDVSLSDNENLLILGPSGSGKSTLLHLLSGILRNKQAELNLNGKDYSKISNKEMDFFRAQYIGLILQESLFIKSLSAKENLLLAQKFHKRYLSDEKIHNICAQLNIEDKLDSKTYNLSKGEQQRLNIARALLHQPEMLLADEPTSALDDTNAEKVINTLLELTAHNTHLIIVTHDQRIKEYFDSKLIIDA